MRALFLSSLVFTALSAVPALASETSDLFEKKCSTCHGLDGKGDTKMGKKFHAPDFTGDKWQKETTDKEIQKAIEEGVVEDGKRKMPAWKGKLTPEQISDLGKYSRTFKAK
jgi:mono/diheme cytochrome c family protein